MRVPGTPEKAWITVSFSPTLEDAGVSLRYLTAHSPQVQDTLRRNRNLGLLLGGSVVGLMLVVEILSFTAIGRWLEPYLRYGMPSIVAVGMLILIVMAVHFRLRLMPKASVRRALEQQARSGALETDLRPMSVSIDGSGLSVDKGTSKYWHDWAVVQRVVESEQRLLVFYTRDQAVTIPIDAFEYSEQAAEFRRLIEANLRRALGETSAPPTIPAKR